MEASVETSARLEGEKARRIIEAMRASVGRRGAAGATFDHVAREAGVSRGLLHYYFGSKERLLVEVVRHDCEVRNRNMDERLAKAQSVDEILDALVVGLEEFLEDDAGGQAVIYEMLSASRRSLRPSPRSCSRSATASASRCWPTRPGTSRPRSISAWLPRAACSEPVRSPEPRVGRARLSNCA